MGRIKKMIKWLLGFPGAVYLGFITHLPGECGFSLRYLYWKRRLKCLGERSRIDTGVYFQNPRYISVGENTWIDKNVIILAGLDLSKRERVTFKNQNYTFDPGHVYIGNDIHIAPNCLISGIAGGVYISDRCGFSADCKVYSFSHHFRSVQDGSNREIYFGGMVRADQQCMISGPVFLGQNVGVALNTVILPGASILEDSFVAINSVVHKGRYANNSFIEGSPAKVVGERFKT